MVAKLHMVKAPVCCIFFLFAACAVIGVLNANWTDARTYASSVSSISLVPDHTRALEEYASQEFNRHTCLHTIRQSITDAFKDIFIGKKHVALVDVATYDNYGDAFIWDGEQQLIQYFGHEVSYICAQCVGPKINSCEWDGMANMMKNRDDWLILYQGGGNWGTIWQSTHDCRLKLLRAYLTAGLTVVSMPQSVYYDLINPRNNTTFVNEQRFWEEEAPKLPGKMVVSCRQHDSCDFLAKHFPKLEIRRVPDIAFMIPPIYRPRDPVTDIIFLVRNDKESVAGFEQNLKTINATIGSVSYEVYDWHQIEKFLPTHHKGSVNTNPSLKTQCAAEFLSSGKIIVTDRLHGSILSLLMGKHHIYIDNNYKKVDRTRALALSDKACTEENLHGFKARDMEDAVKMAIKLLRNYEVIHRDGQ
jgi:pyruvyl transferase EpsO